jgi:hypothetical protein
MMEAKKEHILPLVLAMEMVMALDNLSGTSLFKQQLKQVCNRCATTLEKFIEQSHAVYKDDPIASEEYSIMQINFSRIIDGITLEDLLKPIEDEV